MGASDCKKQSELFAHAALIVAARRAALATLLGTGLAAVISTLSLLVHIGEAAV